jgi:hypothetical protein
VTSAAEVFFRPTVVTGSATSTSTSTAVLGVVHSNIVFVVNPAVQLKFFFIERI